MSLKKYVYTFLLTFSINMIGIGQSTNMEKVKAINNYINFSNEGTHGLLIVHRLLENFNKSINKYVDLPDQQINFYSNKDLPQDIFEDPENWFYETSPNEWFVKATTPSIVLPADKVTKLNTIITEMKTILVKINKLRFDLEEQIKTLDLTKRENLSLVYDKLEDGVRLYKDYYKKQLILETEIDIYIKTLKLSTDEIQFPEVLASMNGVYKSTRSALHALYMKEDDNYAELIKSQQLALTKFDGIVLANYNSTRLINSRVQLYWANIKRQTAESIKAEQLFTDSETIPDEYKLYDKYYYYYNIAVINKFNRYGNGIVFELNRILEYIGVPIARYFEMPHYFKVIYPKLLEKTDVLAASDPVVKSLPTVVKGRNVVTATRTIKVDSFVVDFKMYDHKIIDKDVVSISYNGDWIVEKLQISEKPYEFTLKLNNEGKNFLLLHADDMGRNPPATIALSYTYKGKRELIILNSDTNKSEVIEILVK
ncbi:MAG: hypothetical protein IPO92_20770 [Saprospiraceae bacterium]|nr:hypothetical protein [Saprospiraceae bacterium]